MAAPTGALPRTTNWLTDCDESTGLVGLDEYRATEDNCFPNEFARLDRRGLF